MGYGVQRDLFCGPMDQSCRVAHRREAGGNRGNSGTVPKYLLVSSTPVPTSRRAQFRTCNVSALLRLLSASYSAFDLRHSGHLHPHCLYPVMVPCRGSPSGRPRSAREAKPENLADRAAPTHRSHRHLYTAYPVTVPCRESSGVSSSGCRSRFQFLRSSFPQRMHSLRPTEVIRKFSPERGWPFMQCVFFAFTCVPFRTESCWLSDKSPHRKFSARLSSGTSFQCRTNGFPSGAGPWNASQTRRWIWAWVGRPSRHRRRERCPLPVSFPLIIRPVLSLTIRPRLDTS